MMTDAPPGWAATDIGGAERGGASLNDKGVLTIYAGGADIFAAHDSFRFVSEPASKGTDFSTRLLCMLDTDPYAKAGLMARWGHEPDAPFALVNAFPDGSVAMCSRPTRGAVAIEKHVQSGSTNDLELRLTVENSQAAGYFRHGNEPWRAIAKASVPTDATFDKGYAVCAHLDSGFTVARFAPSGSPIATAHPAETPLSDDWQTSGDGRLWQDITVEPGKRYRFTADVSAESPATTKSAQTIELRLEATLDGQPVALNAVSLPPGPSMSVTGTSISNRIRAFIITSTPGKITVHRASLADLSSANDACAAQ
jgi:regulation of enolase protein 1 (concanavalin A-like superfamily)